MKKKYTRWKPLYERERKAHEEVSTHLAETMALLAEAREENARLKKALKKATP